MARRSRFDIELKPLILPSELIMAVDEFADIFSQEIGVSLSRSQAVAFLVREALRARNIDVLLTLRKKPSKRAQTMDSSYVEGFDETEKPSD